MFPLNSLSRGKEIAKVGAARGKIGPARSLVWTGSK